MSQTQKCNQPTTVMFNWSRCIASVELNVLPPLIIVLSLSARNRKQNGLEMEQWSVILKRKTNRIRSLRNKQFYLYERIERSGLNASNYILCAVKRVAFP